MDPSTQLSKTDCAESPEDIARMARIPYREAVGSLMYAAIATRPDIAFAVSMLSQFLDNPGPRHWEAAKRIFRYLQGTKTWVLTLGGQENALVGYTDADGASQEHRHAISGHVFFINGGAVSWSSRKQELITLSTAEAEQQLHWLTMGTTTHARSTLTFAIISYGSRCKKAPSN